MNHPRVIVLAVAITSVVSVALGCTKGAAVRPAAPMEIGVWVYETFPPTGPGEPSRFRLTAEELRRLGVPAPDLAQATDHDCKCGIPRFGLHFYRGPSDEAYAEGHFFHGPDDLVLSFEDGRHGRLLLGQTRFHDAIVEIIRDRGHWK